MRKIFCIISIVFIIFSCGETIQQNNDNYSHDLAAITISGPNYVYLNWENTWEITVKNNGLNTESEFVVKLMKGDGIEISSTSVSEDISPEEELTFYFDCVSNEAGEIYLYGEVLLDSDEYSTNNRTTKLTVDIISDNPFPQTYIGTDSTFDVLTWNIQTFPLNGNLTVSNVIAIIEDLSPDFIALQEIQDATDFNTVKNSLEGWEGFRANSAYYNINLAILYNTETIQIESIQEIYTDDGWAFPRNPLVTKLIFYPC